MGKIVKKSELADKQDLSEQLQKQEDVEVNVVREGQKVVRKDAYAAFPQAQKIIEEAKSESQRIKNEAQHLLARVGEEREKARKQGFEAGREEGRTQVSQLVAEIMAEKERMFDGLEQDAVRLVYDIAEKIIGRELSEREGAIVDLIRQALHAAMGQNITILVHPQDLETVRKNHAHLIQVLDASKTIHIRADDKVKSKGCVIETEIGTIDAQLETQLAAIRKAFEIEDEDL